MKMSYNVMMFSEAFEKLRKAKALEIEAIEQAHRAILDDLGDNNSEKPKNDGNSCINGGKE